MPSGLRMLPMPTDASLTPQRVIGIVAETLKARGRDEMPA